MSTQSSTTSKIIKAYIERLKRPDARPLDLSSETQLIEGLTCPIHVSRDDILSTGMEELGEALGREWEPFDTRLPLEVNFRMESRLTLATAHYFCSRLHSTSLV